MSLQLVEILDDNNETEVIDVELGLMNDRYAEVKGGLQEGDIVITGSSRDLLPSQKGKSDNKLMPNDTGKNEKAKD